MYRLQRFLCMACISLSFLMVSHTVNGQDLPLRYATLELFTNTPCPICGSQNPGFFSRLDGYKGFYHLISFYPGTPYPSCIFYQANIPENTARFQFYPQVFGTPTVVINGIQFKSSGSVSTSILDAITGDSSWLEVTVDETAGMTRSATITLQDYVGGSLTTGRLFAVIVERDIMYTAPNGETMHHNVFRKFLTDVNGEDVDMSSGMATKTYQYTVDPSWQPDETYVIAWLMDPDTKEIYNSGTKYDPGVSATDDIANKTSVLNIYPNPASEEVHIALPGDMRNASLKIFDISGHLVSGQVLSGTSPVTISTGDWLAGSYDAEVVLGDRVLEGRFQVVRGD